MEQNPLGWRVRIVTGAALAIMAAVAVRVDVLNNWQYGLTVSPELASILVLAAIGVVAIPVAAAILGWSRHLRITAAICVALTVWSAVNAYSSKQGAAILAAQGAQARYEQALAEAQAAREEAAAARKDAAAISETASADALADLVSQARARAADLGRRAATLGLTCTAMKACRAAEDDLATLIQRLGQAQAKTGALARAERAGTKVKEAKADARDGPKEASMAATVIARYLDADPAATARCIALVLTGLGIAVTQLIALLGGQAARLIVGGWQGRPAAAKPLMKTGAQGPKGGINAPNAAQPGSTVVPFNAARRSVKSWLDRATDKGGELRGGDALKAYRRHGGPMAAAITADELRGILAELLGEDAIVKRASGYVVRGRSLRTSATATASC